jgi:hypothetical protein
VEGIKDWSDGIATACKWDFAETTLPESEVLKE